MENSKKIRIALIGLGDIAKKAYLPIVANHSQVSPILCTRNRDVLNILATEYRINETYTNLDELIKNKPDAVMVHSATESHFSIVLKLIEAGIPVFVDKPLCYSLVEVKTILNLATQKKIAVYLGFNRRFAPLVKLLKAEKNPIQINWQKNRVNLPGDARVFVFDDFIHVVDSLRFLGTGSIENLQVFPKLKNNQLESLQVQWQIEELTSGIHYQNEEEKPIGFGNWDSTLYKRGFVTMFEDWLQVLQQNTFDETSLQDIWDTHSLCERIVRKIESD